MAKLLRIAGSVLLGVLAVQFYWTLAPAPIADTAAQAVVQTSAGGWMIVPDPQTGVWRMNTTTGSLQYCSRPNGIKVECQPPVPANPN